MKKDLNDKEDEIMMLKKSIKELNNKIQEKQAQDIKEKKQTQDEITKLNEKIEELKSKID